MSEKKADSIKVRRDFELGYTLTEVAERNGVCRQRVAQILAEGKHRSRKRVNKAYRRVWASQFQDLGLARSRVRTRLFSEVRRKIDQHYEDLKLGEGAVATRLTDRAKQAVYDFRYKSKNMTLGALANLALALNSRVVIDFEVLTPQELEEIGTPDVNNDGNGAPQLKPNPGHS